MPANQSNSHMTRDEPATKAQYIVQRGGYPSNKAKVEDMMSRVIDIFCKSLSLMDLVLDDDLKRIIARNGGIDKTIRTDISTYLMHLAVSDGGVSISEAEMISFCLGFSRTPAQIYQLIKENNIDSPAFQRRVPVILRIAVALDNMGANVKKDSQSGWFHFVVLAIFKDLGEIMIQTGGATSQEEIQAYTQYEMMLRDFINRNFTGSMTATNRVDQSPIAKKENSGRNSSGLFKKKRKR